jgi:cobalamin biosynthesis protein CobT
MKKRLEAELISIAHRILKLKNKSEVGQLYKETQKLYETLAVLKFYQDNFESVKSDVAEDILEEKLAQHIEAETPQEVVPEVGETEAEPTAGVEETTEVEEEVVEEEVEEETPEQEEEVVAETEEEVVQPESEVEVAAALDEEESETEEATEADETEESKAEEPLFKPIFELAEEEEELEPAETVSEFTPETKKVIIEEFLGENYTDPVFVKPNEVSLFADATEEVSEPKSSVVNETSSKSIAIGLNDRIGFVKHLFDESNEDFNRVVSQLNTFDSFEEAKNFIDDMVKPDYNNWQGNEDFAERFMELIEHKFQ